MNEITRRIYETLKNQQKRPIDLCRATGISTATLSVWKNTDRVPDTKLLVKVAEFLGVSMGYLTGNDIQFIDSEAPFHASENDTYYLNREAVEIAQAVYDRPELKVLFDAGRKASKEDIEQAAAMLDYLYKKEHPDE